jgi:hypothetical protein
LDATGYRALSGTDSAMIGFHDRLRIYAHDLQFVTAHTPAVQPQERRDDPFGVS